MKYTLTVNNQTYEVDIEDINARPVVATVDGVRFEVTPENRVGVAQPKPETTPAPEKMTPVASSALSSDTLAAPLPGTVTEVFVKPGDAIEAGQVVLVIEAMKMKNSIRSTHTGTVEAVLVSAGQSVAHKQGLVKFTG